MLLNMYAQVDEDGYQHRILDSIIDCRKDESAVDTDDLYVKTKSGQNCLRQSTTGWKFLVLWENGEEQWMPLKLLKETLPIA